MDSKQQFALSRLIVFENLKVAAPIATVVFLVLIIVAYIIYLNAGPRKLVHCRYQYFVISQSKFNAGSAIVACKLEDGKLISFSKSAPWVPPTVDSEMEVYIAP